MTHAKLREAAEAATPGPWDIDADDMGRTIVASPVEIVARDTRHNSAFIALANPAAVLALLDEIAEKDATITRLEAENAELRAERDQVAGESAWWKRVVDGEHVPSGEVASIKHLHPAMVKPIYDAHKGTAVADVIAGLIFSLAITQNREQFLVGHANDRATRLEAELSAARAGLERQCDNMAFVLNHAELYGWHDKFSVELAEDRQAAITGGE